MAKTVTAPKMIAAARIPLARFAHTPATIASASIAPSPTKKAGPTTRLEGGDAPEGVFMIAAAVAVTILVGLTILIHYEVLRLTSALVPELGFVPPRARVAFVVFACFAAHTIEVWLGDPNDVNP